MQRGESSFRLLRRRRRELRHDRRTTHPDPLRPADIPGSVLYGVHVGTSPAPERGTWAAYVKATREHVGMNKSELARRLGIDRGTITRWESDKNRPEDATVVESFATLFGLDPDEALTAAGLRSGQIADRPARDVPLDPDLRIIMRRLTDPTASEAERATIRATLRYLAQVAEQQERGSEPGRAAG
ncbi:helix-turn-helix transcriptional regulator [Micromonospora sp. NPDC047793]|uniref:helix-turn-helix domain-containing protein n=1 Tax=Micromonospora sp. NPDC047793 TaxID=3154342 RepID=UPI0033C9ABD4